MGKVCNITLTCKNIIGIDKSFEYNSLVTLKSFLIYKEWLLFSLQGKHRQGNNSMLFFRHELQSRLNIYENCSGFDFILKENVKGMIDIPVM